MTNTSQEYNRIPESKPSYRVERVPAMIRVAIVVLGFLAGGMVFVGSGLALMFELDGFGIAGGPRPAYVRVYIAALVAALVLPFVMLRLLLPRTSRKLLVISAASAAGVVMVFLFWLGIIP